MKEFELIRQIQQDTSVSYTTGFEHGVKLGIGDDAAVLEATCRDSTWWLPPIH